MTSTADRFTAITGSIVGREHLRCHRNNQDGVAVRRSASGWTLAVTDGCSAGKYSEVGARLGAAWLAMHTEGLIGGGIDAVADGLEAYLGQLVEGRDGVGRAAFVRDHLLFTFLVASVDAERVVVFGVGDGAVSINGEARVLASGPDNAPPYLGYRLVDPAIADTRPRCHFGGGPRELQSVLIGSDGVADLIARSGEVLRDGKMVGDLSQFEQHPRYLRNRSLMQKRLAVIGPVSGKLSDDTTLALLRRLPEVSP